MSRDTSSIPLRELKKARAKIALYEASLELIGENSFRAVLVDDICRKAELSKVTFFKFFRQKEDLLVYYMRVWLTRRLIELEAEPKRGFGAVRYILFKVVQDARIRPGLMPSLIAFLSEMSMHPCMPELSEAEVSLLFPENPRLGAQSPDMFALFTRWMREAEADGALRPEVRPDTAVKALFTIFYGAFLSGQLYRAKDLTAFYEEHLTLLEKGRG